MEIDQQVRRQQNSLMLQNVFNNEAQKISVSKKRVQKSSLSYTQIVSALRESQILNQVEINRMHKCCCKIVSKVTK